MLKLLDQTIRNVLDTGWGAAPAKPGFYFTIPDEEWRQKVQGDQLRLNIYLYEISENRSLGRAEWDVVPGPSQQSVRSRPPAYIDCHYLISAWSPAEDSEAMTPMLDEHEVLAEALRVLLRNPDVNPGALGIADDGQVFQQAHVYLTVAPPETPRVLNDFWSTMKLPWRPAIQLVATAPLDLLQESVPDQLVTTSVQRYFANRAGTGEAEELIQIGGLVLRAVNDTPLAGVTVERMVTGETATTDSQGRFIFSGLRRGIHRLRAAAEGLTPVERDLNVPDAPAQDHVFRMS
jgi:hypothetical protein